MQQKPLFEKLLLSPEGGRMYSWLGIIVVAVCVIGCIVAVVLGDLIMFALCAAAAVVVWLTFRALGVIIAGRSTLPPSSK